MGKYSLVAAAVCAGLALSAGVANATPTLSVEAFLGLPSNGTLIPLISASQPGALASFGSTSSGPFVSLSLTTFGEPTVAGLDNGNISISAAAGTVVTIVASEQGLTALAASYLASYAFAAAGTSPGTVQFSDFIDSANGAFDLSPADLIASGTLQLGGPPATASGTALATGLTKGGTFSETEELQITFTRAGSNVTSSSLSAPVAVPEPAPIALLGTAVAGLVGFGRRKRG